MDKSSNWRCPDSLFQYFFRVGSRPVVRTRLPFTTFNRLTDIYVDYQVLSKLYRACWPGVLVAELHQPVGIFEGLEVKAWGKVVVDIDLC